MRLLSLRSQRARHPEQGGGPLVGVVDPAAGLAWGLQVRGEVELIRMDRDRVSAPARALLR